MLKRSERIFRLSCSICILHCTLVLQIVSVHLSVKRILQKLRQIICPRVFEVNPIPVARIFGFVDLNGWFYQARVGSGASGVGNPKNDLKED